MRAHDDSRDRERDDELITELRAIRPSPRPEFRRELDRRAAAGFPPRRRDHADRPVGEAGGESRAARGRGLRERLRVPAGLRLGPALAGAAIVCVVATAVVVSSRDQAGLVGSGSEGSSIQMASEDAAATDQVAPNAASEVSPFPAPQRGGDAIAANRNHRAVERDASLTLATEPKDVPEVTSGVLRVVGEHGGIVLSSTTRSGEAGVAGAEFSLKIPSANLSQALSDLSELATVRDRRESTLDITAPTVSVTDQLAEARARVRGLLKALAEATTEAEREAIEIDLRPAQRRVARLRTQLDRLHRRANFADVSVAIVTGEAGALPEEEEWTLADAADDALRLLTTVAGILLVAAAILAPVAVLLLVAWLLRRIWVRSARERALRDDQPS